MAPTLPVVQSTPEDRSVHKPPNLELWLVQRRGYVLALGDLRGSVRQNVNTAPK